MAPTTRKVTAQRKFAQGAFVPAAAAAGPSGVSPSIPQDRRETQSTSNDNCKVFLNRMSAKSLLDVVSYNDSHLHVLPVVLLEKLKIQSYLSSKMNTSKQTGARNGESTSNAKCKSKAKPKGKVVKRPTKKPKTNIKKRITPTVNEMQQHTMTLRSRNQINKPNWLSSAASNAGTETTDSVHSLYTPSLSFVAPTNVSKKTTPRKNMRNTRSTKLPNFTLDDNRPLQHFVNSSTPRAPAPPVATSSLMGPPRSIPNRPNEYQPSSSVVRTGPRQKNAASVSQTFIPRPSGSNYRQMPRIVNVGSLNPCRQSPPRHPTPPPYPFPMLLQPRGYYYSVQGIRRWIDSSMANDEFMAAASTSQQNMCIPEELNVNNEYLMQGEEEHNGSIRSNASYVITQPEALCEKLESACLEQETPVLCNADLWHTVEDIAKASQSDFDARCKICEKCTRIKKLVHLTTLLKRQNRIDWIVEDADQERQSDSASVSSLDRNVILTLDLIPRHEHLVINLKVSMINETKRYSASVIPRPVTAVTKQFNWTEHDRLLDEVIETLSLNMGDAPCDFGAHSDNDAIQKEKKFVSKGKLKNCDFQEKHKNSFPKKKEIVFSSIKLPPQIKPYDETVSKKTILDAPTFYPSLEELEDPIVYLDKLLPLVEEFGICKIVPQQQTVPTCKADDDLRFEVSNQYVSRLYSRWGAGSREMCGIRACLDAQNIPFPRPPLLEGIEINLPKLHAIVQSYGGLVNVMERKKWGRIAEKMGLNRNQMMERKLDTIYFKYLLPVDTLSDEERAAIALRIEKAWSKRYQQLLVRAGRPLHRQQFHLGISKTEPPEDELEDMSIKDIEECIKPGITMNLAKFRKLASTAYDNLFGKTPVTVKLIEQEYWNQVTLAVEHIVVHAAAIDTQDQGLGFAKLDDYSEEPLNLKRISSHNSNVLKALGPTLGVTIPTLHLGMIFSTSCWHRDPHSLPWIEYSHYGATKIWYGVSEPDGAEFRVQLNYLNPIACQTKTLWLPSDITAASPVLLRDRGVKVYRVEQNPGEYVYVTPRAYSSYFNTGFNVSESAYFANEKWLDKLPTAFEEVRMSCEPTMFAFEHILKCIAEDPDSTLSILERIKPLIEKVYLTEIKNRKMIAEKGISWVILDRDQMQDNIGRGRRSTSQSWPPVWNTRDEEECEICRCTLYFSKGLHIPSRDSCVCLEDFLRLIAAREEAKREALEEAEKAAEKAAERAAQKAARKAAVKTDIEIISDDEDESQVSEPVILSKLPHGVDYRTLEVHYLYTNEELLQIMEAVRLRLDFT